MSEDRRNQIMAAIVEHFVKTAEPVGSKTIILTYNFRVSPATVRNDMADLEEEGLITQPHTSAGRIPTDKGYRFYVDELADFKHAETLAKRTLDSLLEHHRKEAAKQHVHEAVALLSQASPNMAFATIPQKDDAFFMGFSKMLRQPEFMEAPLKASQVMEVIEDRNSFMKLLRSSDIDREPRIFIGEENVLSGIESCSLITTAYTLDGFQGLIGILGPKRMPYAYNTAALTQVRDLLENHSI